MAGLIRNPVTPQALDQLFQLTELVNAITDKKNLADIITNIQAEQTKVRSAYDDLAALKAADDETAKNLALETGKNTKVLSDLNDERKALDESRANAETSISKSQTLLKQLEQAQREYDTRVRTTDQALSQRSQALTDRETIVAALQAKVDAMKLDYDTKLDAIKKLAG